MTAGLSDFHSHIFPAVDDGSRSVEDSLEGLSRMIAAGVTRVTTTPHIQGSLTTDRAAFAATMRRMDGAWEAVQPEAVNAFPNLEFRRGHEVMLDIPDPDLSDPRLHLGGTQFILVEWPRLQVPPGTPEVLKRIVEGGLIPVVAHPERYSGIDPQLRVVYAWKEAGALLQGNYGSLVGRYGPGARGLMVEMLEHGLIDYLGSDFHCRPEYDLFIAEGRAALEQLGGDAQLEVLGGVNPNRLFEGETPMPVPPLELEPTLMQRFKGWIVG